MSENLFTRMYSATKEALDLARKPIVERSLKRKFNTVRDNALSRKLDLEKLMSDALESIKDYELSKVLNFREEIKACNAEIKAVEEHYFEMFGESMKNID
jgi:hypothetical protein